MEKLDRKIHFLDGNRFNRAIIAGSNWLIEREKHLDDINVFPVPDSDTGTNMAGTLRSLVLDPDAIAASSIAESSKRIADQLLISARGNSGSILAQFFQGLAEGFEACHKVTTKDFAEATHIASKKAVEAVSDPQEGTILTVMREWSEEIIKIADHEEDFSDLLHRSLTIARSSMERTKDQLEVLRKANVVDAGALGFMYLIEGIVDYLEHGRNRRDLWNKINEESRQSNAPQIPESDYKYRYCTECLLFGENPGPKIIQDLLSSFSDSVVVVGSKNKMKIHAHTDQPGKLFQVLHQYGKTDMEKIEDIRQQEKDVYGNINRDIALVTDTSCDLPEDGLEKYNVHRIPFRITMGNENLIDRITISDKEFYQRMENTNEVAKTSQLSNIELKTMYEWTSKNFTHTIGLHIARPLSASIDAAKKIIPLISDEIVCMDSKSICVGLGLIVAETGRAIEAKLPFDEVCKRAQWACDHIQQLFTVEDLKYLIRGGRLKATKGKIATLLNIKPLMHTDKTGALQPFSKAFGSIKVRDKILDELKKRTQGKKNIHFAIGHCNNEPTALWYKEKIQSIFAPKSIYVTTISPTIGSHAGPGTISIAFLPAYPMLTNI